MTSALAEPRARRSQEQRSAETRERLIVAAIDCIDQVGYVEATTTLIVAHAKVSRGALQHHFATKADLILAVIDRVSEELNMRFDVAALTARPLEERVAAIVNTYWDVFTSAAFRAVLGISLGVGNEPMLANRLHAALDEQRESHDVVWHDLFGDTGRTPAELSAIRRVVMSAVRGFGVLRVLQPHGNAERDRRTLTAIALRELQG